MHNAAEITLNTLAKSEEMRAALGAPSDSLAKAWTQSGSAISGITAYDLEAPAKLLFPVLTPLRKSMPRMSGKGGIQANWRAVTGINTTKMGMGIVEGQRGGVMTSTTADYIAIYKELGLEDSVTFKADRAAVGFEDLKSLAQSNLLKATMIEEEFLILAGNTSLALGTTGNATLTQSNTGGSLLGNTAYGVGVVALSMDGYRRAKLAGGVVQTYVRTNADGTTTTLNGGTAAPSTQVNITTANDAANAHSINATVTAVPGAVGYAWFWATAAANLTLGAITAINSVLITATATGTTVSPGTANFAALAATDYSTDAYVFDGLMSIAFNATLNSYQAVMATGNAGTGTPLTADGAGGVKEIDTALKSFWDNYRLSPSKIWVNSQEMKNITNAILKGTTSAAQRFTVAITNQGMLAGGFKTASYLNKYTMNGGQEIPVEIHPNLPPGVILFDTDTLPYPQSNVANVKQMLLRQDYFSIEWPLITRKYQFGVYFDGVMQHYFPPSIGVIYNIADGLN